MKKAIIAFLLLGLGVAYVTYANQERPVSFSTVRFESSAAQRAGRVVVEATQDDGEGLVAMKIHAWGKDFALGKDDLREIAGAKWNGLRVVDDSGILGQTIWIRFEVANSSGTRDEALIRVCRDGTIQVGRMPKK